MEFTEKELAVHSLTKSKCSKYSSGDVPEKHSKVLEIK